MARSHRLVAADYADRQPEILLTCIKKSSLKWLLAKIALRCVLSAFEARDRQTLV
ncbi:hypothetical protein [Kingella oralis]|uniref:hypothetical protein n=1 Tax=Kingella oralis TaxID=505 RepID=UPI0034E3FD9E